jgi:hypothetical protein
MNWETSERKIVGLFREAISKCSSILRKAFEKSNQVSYLISQLIFEQSMSEIKIRSINARAIPIGS